jgi:hypothetical protein
LDEEDPGHWGTLVGVNIAELLSSVDSEISRLQQARALLSGDGRTAPTRVRKHHTMSAEGRARVAAAQRKRWAKQKRAAKQDA